MGYLKEKSGFNIDSAQELINKSYYAPSVHCSYYGSFQYMKYTLKNLNSWTYDYIEQECLNYRGGTHNYIIDKILLALKNKINSSKDYADIKRKIKELKLFRTNSDYFNVQILHNDAQKSLDYSKEIISALKKTLLI